MAKILVVDDDERIVRLIKNILIQSGHTVSAYLNFDDLNKETVSQFDIILLDVMMPGINGFEACRCIRNKVDCPIIFITAKSEEDDVVYGFGLGADDYIKKPFGAEELKARINAHIRRNNRKHSVKIQCGNIEFDLQGMKLMVKELPVNLTKGEYEICEFLVRNKGQVFSREQIYENVFGYESDSNDNTIATHIKNIRRKLNNHNVSPIETVWGIGYKWIM